MWKYCSILLLCPDFKKYNLEVFFYNKPTIWISILLFLPSLGSVIYLLYYSNAEARWSFYRHTQKYKAVWNINVLHSIARGRNTDVWISWHTKTTALWDEMLPSASCGQLAKACQKRHNEQKDVLEGRITDVEIRREFQLDTSAG